MDLQWINRIVVSCFNLSELCNSILLDPILDLHSHNEIAESCTLSSFNLISCLVHVYDAQVLFVQIVAVALSGKIRFNPNNLLI